MKKGGDCFRRKQLKTQNSQRQHVDLVWILIRTNPVQKDICEVIREILMWTEY